MKVIFSKRVQKLYQHLQMEKSPCVLVGSSMGGYVSLVSAQNNDFKNIKGLFLLAPALYMPDYQVQHYEAPLKHVEIVHGWFDDIIPVEHSIKYAQQTQCTLHLIKGDHRLNSSLTTVITLFTTYLNTLSHE